MTFKEAFIKLFSSSDEVSFGRAMAAVAFLACIGWDTFFVVFAARHLAFEHMNVHDILPTSEQLKGQVLFCAATYGINKLTEIFSMFGNK